MQVDQRYPAWLDPSRRENDHGAAPALSLVIPVFNEARSVVPLYAQIRSVLGDYPAEIIFVDDGSTDDTAAELALLAHRDAWVRVLGFARNFGKSQALAAGFAEARGQVLITLDADLQDDPAEIPRFLAAIEGGADLVCGWKRDRQDPWTKTLPSRAFNWVAARVTGVQLHDFNCGFKAYSRRLVDRLDIYGEQHRVIPAIAYWHGYRVVELPVHHRPRLHGQSKFGPWRFLAGILDLTTVVFLTRFNRKPLHLFGLLGVGLALAGMVIGLYMVLLRVEGERIGDRPLLLLGVLLLVMGVQFITLGLLGEILAAYGGRNTPGARVYSVVQAPQDPLARPADSRRGTAVSGPRPLR